MADTPKSIVYIRPDTIGDLVIFESVLVRLQAAWPEARHVLLVRSGYESLSTIFPSFLHWETTSINPFKQKPGDVRVALESLFERLSAHAPDLIVAPTLNRTWLEVAVAGRFKHARRVALGSNDVDPLFATALELELGIDARGAFEEQVPVEKAFRDWENNHRLAEYLAQRADERPFPTVAIPADASERARHWLVDAGLEGKPWAAVFAGGLANVPIKGWPITHFAELSKWLERERAISPVLLGHESERVDLEAIAREIEKLGATPPRIWLGRDGELGVLAAVLQTSRFYVGHDTGAMHIAAAARCPVVGIFGGGHWPRFRPVGAQVISVVQPLPCFGCNWDCEFGDAPCVKTIGVSDVQQAVDLLLAAGAHSIDEVFEAKRLSSDAWKLIAAVTPRYRALQSDRLDRQHTIEELKAETNGKDREIDALKSEADTKDTEIAALKKETDAKDREIEGLKKETIAIKTELEGECATKDAEIGELKAAANVKDDEIVALKATCDEREKLIIEQDGHIKFFQKTVAELNTSAAARQAELVTIQTFVSTLPPEPEKWAHDLSAKDVHIGNLENNLKARDQLVAALQASVENYTAGYGSLEQSKHYGKLLAEKEAVIQSLHQACVEREAVIKQLTLNPANSQNAVGRLWTGFRQYWRLKYWHPFNGWIFKKVVEEYWMQIGLLQHYPPRPLVWDKLPKPKLPEAKLPQVGIVTPSYGQATYLESTLLSVLNQQYPKLRYVVQDGGSKDTSPQIGARYADKLHHWESVPDKGQADAIRKGFTHLDTFLRPDDVMAWLNSDDFIAPRALRFVAEYFATHPDVDVVYGHRIIIDGNDQEVGRWIMPPHDPKTLEWIDYVPQETLFWRKRVWDRVGGIDPSFQFALDWDLLARFQQAKAKIVRLPYFLGCFRVHSEQKTNQHIHTIGNEEMVRVRSRFHGERHSDFKTINQYARKARFTGALTARLAAWGVRY